MALRIEIKVVPKSGRLELKHGENGKLKCYLKSAPENGKANKELIRFFAKKLSITQNKISIIRGELSRNKVILVQSIDTLEELYRKFNLEKQSSLL